MNDSEDEYEEEIAHIVFDLGSEITPETLERFARENAEVKYLRDDDSGEQLIQIGETIFRGHWDETVTSNLLFEVQERKRGAAGLLPLLNSMQTDDTDIDVEPHRQAASEVSFYTATNQAVMGERVTLVEKRAEKPGKPSNDTSKSSSQPDSSEDQNISTLLA